MKQAAVIPWHIRPGLLALCLLAAGSARADQPLPWVKDYAAALAQAKTEQRPIFLMLTATWCGPCKMLESQTLPEARIRSGLKEFIWVKAYEDAELNKKFGLGGYPTLVFLDPSADRVLAQSTGYEPPGPFLRRVIAARNAADLPLTKEMEALAAKAFVSNPIIINGLVESGDWKGLAKYLGAAKDDPLREYNFFVGKIHRPAGVSPADLIVLASGDHIVTDSGVLLIPVSRDDKDQSITIIAPGCKVISEPLKFAANSSVLAREFTPRPLTDKDAASFNGRVLLPDGKPAANAIVRICDWDVARADDQGRFLFAPVSPGQFLVRAEYPGGEFQEELNFTAGHELKTNLQLTAVTTIGIRWAVQQREGSPQLVGEGVRTGEAYFSVKHSRFSLERGAETREYWGSDFMLMEDWKSVRQYISKDKLSALESSTSGAPIFWLFDATQYPTGLHAETVRFEDIRAVNGGRPYDEKTYFAFLRGEMVRKGQVYTLRCVRKDCYAKLEITDVTVVPKSPK
jgi:thiol-disulfide isomerase/thioredoxin